MTPEDDQPQPGDTIAWLGGTHENLRKVGFGGVMVEVTESRKWCWVIDTHGFSHTVRYDRIWKVSPR